LVQRRTGFRSPIFGLERLRRGNNAYPAYRSRSRRPILGIAIVAFLLLDVVMVYALTRDDDTIPRGPSPLGLTDRSGQGGSSVPAGVEGRDGTEVAALTLSEEGQQSTSKSTDQEHSRPAAHASGGVFDSRTRAREPRVREDRSAAAPAAPDREDLGRMGPGPVAPTREGRGRAPALAVRAEAAAPGKAAAPAMAARAARAAGAAGANRRAIGT
jgi:hypothetical protein